MLYMVECSFTDPKREDEWNRFYSGHKLDQMLAVPGFRTSQRFRAVDGARCPYLAIHTVDALDVLQGTTYKSRGGGSFGDEWQPYITDWRRSFFSGIDVAPDIALDERVALTDLPAEQVRDSGLAFLWLTSAGLAAAAPQRGIARITRAQAEAVTASKPPGIRVYAPMMARRQETSEKGRTI